MTKLEILHKEVQARLQASDIKGDGSKFTLPEIKEIVHSVLESIEDVTIEHGELRIDKHGTYKSVRREQRKGRNPQTGEEILIKAKQVATWKPAKAFSDKVGKTIVTY